MAIYQHAVDAEDGGLQSIALQAAPNDQFALSAGFSVYEMKSVRNRMF